MRWQTVHEMPSRASAAVLLLRLSSPPGHSVTTSRRNGLPNGTPSGGVTPNSARHASLAWSGVSAASCRWPMTPWQCRQVFSMHSARSRQAVGLALELGEEDRIAPRQSHRRDVPLAVRREIEALRRPVALGGEQHVGLARQVLERVVARGALVGGEERRGSVRGREHVVVRLGRQAQLPRVGEAHLRQLIVDRRESRGRPRPAAR